MTVFLSYTKIPSFPCRNCFLFAVSPFRLWQATLPGAMPFVFLLGTLISSPASPEKVSVGRSFSFAASEIPPLTLQRTFFRRFEGIQFVKFLLLKLFCLYHLHYTKHNS